MRLLRGHGRTLGILHQRADVEGGLFATPGDVDGGLDRNIPRVEKVEIHGAPGQEPLFRQSGAIVFGGESGNRQCRVHRGPDGREREVRAAGVATALPQIYRDAQSLVAVVLDGFDVLPAHADGVAKALGHIDFAGAGTARGGVIQRGLRQHLQCGSRMSKAVGHAETPEIGEAIIISHGECLPL
jgi:hypothetical protein